MQTSFYQRIKYCVLTALPSSLKTSFWLLKLMLPISLVVRLLDYYGAIVYLSNFFQPLFNLIGLSGSLAIVFITSVFLPLYGTIAVMASLAMTLREATILSLMCLVAHNLFVECAVTHKTGSSYVGMILLRIGMAFVVATFLNVLLPVDNTPFVLSIATHSSNSIHELLTDWLTSSFYLIITVLFIVTALFILQRLLLEFELIEKMSKPLKPLMKLFGLPENSPFLWIVGNLAGLAYGGAIMVDMVKQGKLSLQDANTVNYHLSISHSLLEDTLLFAALGINLGIIVGTRLFFAFMVVWVRRGLYFLFSRRRV